MTQAQARYSNTPRMPQTEDHDEAPRPAPKPTPLLQSVGAMAANQVGKVKQRRVARLGAGVNKAAARIRGKVLRAAGLGSFCVAAFEAGTIVGWCVVGLSALLMEIGTDK